MTLRDELLALTPDRVVAATERMSVRGADDKFRIARLMNRYPALFEIYDQVGRNLHEEGFSEDAIEHIEMGVIIAAGILAECAEFDSPTI